MTGYMKIQKYLSNKVLPFVRQRFPEACMETVPNFMGSEFMKVSFYEKMPEVFGGAEIPFMSLGRQQYIKDLASALSRKNPCAKVVPSPSGFLIAIG